MKSVSFKNGIFLVMMFAILLTSCSFGTQTQKQIANISSVEETQTIQNTDEREKNFGDRHAYTQPVKMIPLETKIQSDNRTLSYGKLQITLPDGVTIEEQNTENDMRVIDLNGAEKSKNAPFPPRIWLANYCVAYQSEWELASALLDILPDITLRICFKTNDARRYLFTYNKPNQIGYIMVYGDDIYLVEELAAEQDYSFGRLLDDRYVHWENSMQKIGSRRDYAYCAVDKIKVEENYTLLALQVVDENNMRKLTLFQDGYFISPIKELSFENCPSDIQFEDYNFDGCPDMIISSSIIYLWNTDKKEYEAVQMPEEFSLFSIADDIALYPETKTIWTQGCEYLENGNAAHDWTWVDYMETFWQWEENAVLTKKRACTAQVREEEVRILVYEYADKDKIVLRDETVSVAEWEQNSDTVQACYRDFYDEMVPVPNVGMLHKTDCNQEYIPQELLDMLAKAMLDGTEYEILKTLETGKELTKEEVLAFAKDNIALRCDVILAEQSNDYIDYIMIMTDGDNDGIPDIVAKEYFGGTGGFTEYAFYQGQEDGTYEKTSIYYSVDEVFRMISYKGKNYLCRMLVDRDKKQDSGISLICYTDGVQAETRNLMFYPETYDVRLAACAEEQYQPLAQEMLENAVTYKERIDRYTNIDGSSEEKTFEQEYGYRCDLNNDGVLELYDKSIWHPSNLWTVVHIELSGEGPGITTLKDAVWSVEGTPIMVWAEPFAGKNIVHVISLTGSENKTGREKITGLDDFAITGFLVDGTQYQSVYRITADAEYTVRQEYENTQVRR